MATEQLEQSQMNQHNVFDNAFNRTRPKRRTRIREEERIFNNEEVSVPAGVQEVLFQLNLDVETNIMESTGLEYVTVGHGLAGELSTTTEAGDENEDIEGSEGSEGAESE